MINRVDALVKFLDSELEKMRLTMAFKPEFSVVSEAKMPAHFLAASADFFDHSLVAATKNPARKASQKYSTQKYYSRSQKPVQANSKFKCLFCEQGFHFPDQCSTVANAKERLVFVKQKRLCTRCLRYGHSLQNCKSSVICYYCKRSNHHSALCFAKFGSERTTQSVQKGGDAKSPPARVLATVEQEDAPVSESCQSVPTFSCDILSSVDTSTQVPLLTANPKIFDPKTGVSAKIRLVLDTASQKKFCGPKLVTIWV